MGKNETSQNCSYAETVLADIRNKLSPPCNVIALIEEYLLPEKNGNRTTKEMEYIRDSIIKQLPQANESFEYVRNYKLKDK